MNPIFIYQNEATLKKNNKFDLQFSDNSYVHMVNVSPKFDYYICSLYCNIDKTKKIYELSKKKVVDELSQ